MSIPLPIKLTLEFDIQSIFWRTERDWNVLTIRSIPYINELWQLEMAVGWTIRPKPPVRPSKFISSTGRTKIGTFATSNGNLHQIDFGRMVYLVPSFCFQNMFAFLQPEKVLWHYRSAAQEHFLPRSNSHQLSLTELLREEHLCWTSNF